VTTDKALGVPAIWAAVNFLSGTLAGLPLNLYKRTGEGRERQSGSLARLVHDVVNPELTSFDWRKLAFSQIFTGGRHVSFIEQNRSGVPVNIWPLDPSGLTIKRVNGLKHYVCKDGGRTKTYGSIRSDSYRFHAQI